MKRIIMTLLLIGCFIPQSIDAEEFILVSDIGTSAESIALGQVEGFSYGSNAIFENPAGLYRINQFGFSAFTTRVINEVTYTNVAIAGKTPIGTWGFGFMEATVSNIPETGRNTDGEHIVLNTFDYKSSIYKLSYQRDLSQNLHFGTSYSYYLTKFYAVEGRGADLDAGVIYEGKDYEASVFARNLLPNNTVNYNGKAIENLPFHLVFSARFEYEQFEFLPQFKLVDGAGLPSFGLKAKPKHIPFITFMAGFKRHLDVTGKQHQNGSLGIGLRIYDLELHYAYERSDYVLLDHKSYFSITQNF